MNARATITAVRRLSAMAIAVVSSWSTGALAQQTDSSVVPVIVGIAQPPPNVSVDTQRSLDFGTVFRPHPGRGDCVYEVGPDGVSRTRPETDDGRSAAIAGCGFRDGQLPAPGRISFGCIEGSNLSFQTRISRNVANDPILFRVPFFIVRDSKDVSVGRLALTGSVACPAGGAGFVDMGMTIIVPSDTEIASNSERYQFTVTVTVL